MSKWEKVKLGELFKITSGGTPPKSKPEYYENGTIRWVRTGDLKDKYLTKIEGLITKEALKNSSAKIFPVDTVLIAMYGATIGACSILAVEAATNQACAAFLPNSEVDSSYLYYFLFSSRINFINMGVGGAQPNISATILKGIEIPLPPLETQKQIARTLDTAAELLTLRKKQLVELDNLIKATFYEMFGDPVTNRKGWKTVSLNEIADFFIGLTYKPEDVSDTGIIVLRSSNIQNDGLDFNDIVRVNKSVRDKLIVQKNDILMCSRNGSKQLVGKTALINTCNDPMTFGAFMTIIRSQNYNYLLAYFRTPAFRRQLFSSETTTINQITKAMLDRIELPLPPLSLQYQFAEIVSKIEEQKALVQKAIDETQLLFDSLMIEYFE